MTSVECSVYTEVYLYRVIYPSGTFIRVSPSCYAAKTGEVLECGSEFESTKSLFLEGINYVKLADGRGWVFHSKGETKVLELIEVIKKYEEAPAVVPTVTLSENHDLQPRTPTYSRNKNLYWRDIRSKVRACTNFREFSEIVKSCMFSIPQANGPARSAWMTDSPSEQLIRKQIGLITSTSRKGADIVSNVDELEAHLWVLVHMGGQVNHVMQLAVDEANFYFEKLSAGRRSELLSIALEIGAATRLHNTELAKSADILADDIRNFVQRFTIIKSRPDIGSPPSPKGKTHKTVAGVDSRTIVSPQSKGSPVSEVKKNAAVHSPVSSSSSGTWLSSVVCSPPPPPLMEPESREMTDLSSRNKNTIKSPSTTSNNANVIHTPPPSTSIFSDFTNYVRKITSDPEFQFAGLI